MGIIWVSRGSVEGVQQTLGDSLWPVAHRDYQSFVHNEDKGRGAGGRGVSVCTAGRPGSWVRGHGPWSELVQLTKGRVGGGEGEAFLETSIQIFD